MELYKDKIKSELVKKGWSASELARRMGVSRQAVSQLLRCTGVTLKTIDKIAVALDVNPKDLIK